MNKHDYLHRESFTRW